MELELQLKKDNKSLLKRFNQDKRFKEKRYPHMSYDDIIRKFYPPILVEILVWRHSFRHDVTRAIEDHIWREVADEFGLIIDLMEENKSIIGGSPHSKYDCEGLKFEIAPCKSLSKEAFFWFIENQLATFMEEHLDTVLWFDVSKFQSLGYTKQSLCFFSLLEHLEYRVNAKIPSEYFPIIEYYANKEIEEHFRGDEDNIYDEDYDCYSSAALASCAAKFVGRFRAIISDYYEENIASNQE